VTVTDNTARSQTETVAFDIDLRHAPEKVWRALTDPALLAEWLLPVIDFKAEPGAALTSKTQPHPGWDGTVSCRMLEIEPQRKISYTWTVPFLDTVVTFTLNPTGSPAGSGTRLSIVQTGFTAALAVMLQRAQLVRAPQRIQGASAATSEVVRWLGRSITKQRSRTPRSSR
jgi:uncharacterized protein YndB with AHSA1/START domain